MILSISNTKAQQNYDIAFPKCPQCDFQVPTLIMKGETKIINEYDTAYLITPTRYRLYEKAKTTVMEMNFKKVDSLVSEYNKLTNLYENMNAEITKKVSTTIDNSVKSLDNNINTLRDVNRDLDSTKKKIDFAIGRLNDAKIASFKERVQAGMKGFAIGFAAAIIAGILIL